MAEITAILNSVDTATGVVLTITAAPLVAYGMHPARRPTLLIAAAQAKIGISQFLEVAHLIPRWITRRNPPHHLTQTKQAINWTISLR